MPLCPQVTNTPVAVSQTASWTVATIVPAGEPATVEELSIVATTADQAALDAADAMTTATEASAAASEASSAASFAQATANGKNRVNYSTSTPSGTGAVGDIWWQFSGGVVIGQWQYTGSGWTSAPVGNAVIANLDAGKITSGYIDAARIQAGTLNANVIGAGTISGVVIDTTALIQTSGVISGGTVSSTGNLSGASISTTGNLAVTGTAMAGNLYSTGVAGVQTPGTTAETVTWRVESSGGYFMLRRPSSRRELKEHIVDIADIPELDPQLLLQIPVRAYKFKPGVLDETSSRNDVFVPGFIVEEMDAIYPMAVDYDENGQPLMWGESALIPGMLALIQQQAKTIADLQSRVEALEARP